MTILPQLLMCTELGAMKSLISAVNEFDARDLVKNDAKLSHWLGGRLSASVRLIAASPNWNAGIGFGVPPVGSVAGTRLTSPSELAEVSAVPALHELPPQTCSVSVGFWEPPWKS